jgi:hypothetical protein
MGEVKRVLSTNLERHVAAAMEGARVKRATAAGV